jgi:hypothetical protein
MNKDSSGKMPSYAVYDYSTYEDRNLNKFQKRTNVNVHFRIYGTILNHFSLVLKKFRESVPLKRLSHGIFLNVYRPECEPLLFF